MFFISGIILVILGCGIAMKSEYNASVHGGSITMVTALICVTIVLLGLVMIVYHFYDGLTSSLVFTHFL